MHGRIRDLKGTCNGTGNGELYGAHVTRRHIVFVKCNHKFAVFIEIIAFIACKSLEILIRHIGRST